MDEFLVGTFEFNLLIPPPTLLFLSSPRLCLSAVPGGELGTSFDRRLPRGRRKLYLCVSSPTIKDKPVSNVQPAVAFPEHVCNQNSWSPSPCHKNAGELGSPYPGWPRCAVARWLLLTGANNNFLSFWFYTFGNKYKQICPCLSLYSSF